MKIAGLISRFENKEVGKEHRKSHEDGDHDGEREDQPRSNHRPPSPGRLSPGRLSPGRLNIRNAIKNLRAPRSPGNLKNFEKLEEPEAPPLTVEKRVDDVLKSIQSRRSSAEEAKNTDADTNETVDDQNGAGNPREYLISEHSNRTLVVDNKKNKSQRSVLPDTPWSNRNLTGASRPEYSSYEKRTSSIANELLEEEGTQKQHEAEYGTLALKNEDATKSTQSDEPLPPEVVAMSAAAEKVKLKTKSFSLTSPKKSRSMDDVLKRKESGKKIKNLSSGKIKSNGSDDDTDGKKMRRRLSPGLLRRRGSNEKTEPKQKEISVVPPENQHSLRPPTRSLSAGNLRMARSKAKSIRERKARSQSPGDEKAGERQIRPGRKKSESNILAAKEERDAARLDDINSASPKDNDTKESAEPPRSLRRIRGRSPGDDGNAESSSDENKGSGDEDNSHRPTLKKLSSSRGRSPGTLRKSINMTGDVSRDVSPGALRGRSPGTIRKSIVMTGEISRDVSPGALRGRSPGTIRRNADMNGDVCRDVSPDVLGRSQSPSALRKRVNSTGDAFRDASPDVLGRSQSPGALRRRVDSAGEVSRDVSPDVLGRGRSPGAIRKSTNASGQSRGTSPGTLSRSNHTSARGKSPGTLRRLSSNKAKSPGKYSNMSKSSGHSNMSTESPKNGNGARSPGALRKKTQRAKSPGALLKTVSRKKSPEGARGTPVVPPPLASTSNEIVVEPPAHLQTKSDSGPTEEPEATGSVAGSLSDEDLAKKNLSVPRSKSPGALARRQSKTPKANKTQKAQSLFEKKSPSALLTSPRRKLSKDDVSIRLSSFDETPISPSAEYRPPAQLTSDNDGK